MALPRLSVVLLTRNEEQNIEACLASLANQRNRDFEVILVDAASTDRTVAIAHEVRHTFPLALTIEASDRLLPFGEARNLGVSLARAPNVAFLSADTEVDGRWVEEALRSLESNDMVFGRQVHDPHTWTVGSAVRGLRYHFPRGLTDNPLRYASNVAAAYRKDLLFRNPFDSWANAAEDLLLATRASSRGSKAAYNPHMIVRHHDVGTAREELRKSAREGQGWGLYWDELGLYLSLMAWGVLLTLMLALLLVRPRPLTLLIAAAVIWMPALRRAWRRRKAMPMRQLLKGIAASPAFDVVFLVNYLRGLVDRGVRGRPEPKETYT